MTIKRGDKAPDPDPEINVKGHWVGAGDKIQFTAHIPGFFSMDNVTAFVQSANPAENTIFVNGMNISMKHITRLRIIQSRHHRSSHVSSRP